MLLNDGCLLTTLSIQAIHEARFNRLAEVIISSPWPLPFANRQVYA
jgi:hypothetical protein